MAKDFIGSLFVQIRAGVAEFEGDMDKIRRSLSRSGKEFTAVGKNLSTSLTLPIVAAGAVAVAAGVQVDDALDKIRASTGATGKALQGLENDFKSTFANVPQSAEEVSSVISTLNQKLGLSGEPLQNLSKNLLDVTRLLGEDVTGAVDAVSSTFSQWNVDVKDQAGTLDFFLGVSQKTGIGITDLNTQLASSGPILRGLGLSIEESAGLLGQLSKAGVDSGSVMAALKKSVGNLVGKGGVADAGEAIKLLSERIKNAGSDTEAAQLAMKVFGDKAGPQMARLIREGIVSLSDLEAQFGDTEGAIASAVDDTDGAVEGFAKLKNELTLTLAPLGDVILQMGMDLVPALQTAVGVVKSLSDMFASLPSSVRTSIVVFAGVVAAIGPVMFVMGNLITTVSSVIGLFGRFAPAILNAVLAFNPWIVALGAAAAAIIIYKDEIAGAIVKTLEFFRIIDKRPPAIVTAQDTDAFKRIAAEIGVTTEKLKGFIEQNSKAVRIFGEHKKEIAGLKEQFVAGKLSQSEFEAGLSKILKTGIGAAESQGKLGGAVKATGDAAKGTTIDVDALLSKLDKGKKDTDEVAKHFETLGKSFKDLKGLPRQVADDIAFLTKEGATSKQIIKLLENDIIAAAKAAKLFGQELPEPVKQLAALITESNKLKELPEKMRQIGLHAVEMNEKLKLSKHDFSELEKAMRPNITATGLLTNEQIKLKGELLKLRNLPRQVAADIEAMTRAGFSNKEIVEAMGKEIITARDVAIKFGTALPPVVGELAKMVDQGSKTKEMAKQLSDAWAHAIGQLEADFAKGVTGLIFHGNKLKVDLLGIFKQLAESALQIFITGLFHPLFSWVSKLGQKLGDILFGGKSGGGGIFDSILGAIGLGKGGALSNILGKIPGLGAIFGGTAAAAAGAGAAGAGMATVMSAFGPLSIPTGLFGLGTATAAGGAGAAGGAAAGGMGAFGSTLAGFFTNPFTIGIGGAVGVGLLLKKLFSKDAFEKGAAEAARDFGGATVGKKTIEQFLGGIGLSKSGFEGIRKDVLSSPLFFQQVLLPEAVEKGPAAVNELISSFARLEAFGKKWDFGAAAAAAANGNFDLLNKQWVELFSQSKRLQEIIPDFANRLTVEIESGTEASEGLTEGVDDAGDAVDSMTSDIGELGRVLPALENVELGFQKIKSAVFEVGSSLNNLDVSKILDLIGLDFNALAERIRGTIPPLSTPATPAEVVPLPENVPALQTGGIVRSAGLAWLHPDEAVIPDNMASRPVSINVQMGAPTFNISGGGNIASIVRNEIAPAVKRMFENNTRQMTEIVARSVKRAMPGV